MVEGQKTKDKLMNVYERILNILLEARVDMFIQDRLDESRVDELRRIEKAIKTGEVSKKTARRYYRARVGGGTDPTPTQDQIHIIRGERGNKQKSPEDRGSSEPAQQKAKAHSDERKEEIEKVGTGRIARSQNVRRGAKGKNNPNKKYVEPHQDATSGKSKKPQIPC
jgi:hypothetical protein